MQEAFKQTLSGKGDAIFYMGSQTTPPCQENTYHLVFTKPIVMSGCQFKLLRDQSLISNKPKNIHARIEQPINERTLYQISSASIKSVKNILSAIPQSYNKWVLKNKFKKKYKIVCTPKGCFKVKIGGKREMRDCTVNEMNNDIHKVDW